MERIASFQVDHDALTPGMYVSRVDGDVVTYDVRMKRPNAGDYLENAALHTIEHLLATHARSGEHGADVVYVGPMGCRTGFYLLLRDRVSRRAALDLARAGFRFIAGYRGDIPGAAGSAECGNWVEHDLEGARREAEAACAVLADWTVEAMEYGR